MTATLRLSPNFTLAELTLSATANARGWENVPPPEVMEALRVTAQGMEQVRTLLSEIIGRPAPIFITSGYRSPRLNSAIGGSKTSQHVRGEAVDFRAPEYGSPAQIVAAVKRSKIEFDQLINEAARNGARWVHISFGPQHRREVFSIVDGIVREFEG
ncbi:MAG: hypothetical protein K2X32_14210 [Phycisphaerales bacterium]|nr:hypothetical protein [Phycisphaerales bacterium]MBY0263315.1 hypothetical protein [Phycisphaerales bacterium]